MRNVGETLIGIVRTAHSSQVGLASELAIAPNAVHGSEEKTRRSQAVVIVDFSTETYVQYALGPKEHSHQRTFCTTAFCQAPTDTVVGPAFFRAKTFYSISSNLNSAATTLLF